MATSADIRIGISGWTYVPWRKTFFPPGLSQKDELAFASRQLRSIEINGTFYSLQRPTSYQAWHEAVPEDFIFAVKGPRYVTHMLRLKGVERPVANFFASGVLALGKKMGPMLWQFPPNFSFDPDRMAAFFQMLPRDTEAAAKLAHRHDDKVKGRTFMNALVDQPIRHAVEVRHSSFETPEFVDLLRKHDIGLVVADTAGKWPLMEDVTSDFVYVRLHGDEQIYVSGYTDEALDRWAEKVRAWSSGKDPADARLLTEPSKLRPKARDVFVYFDNDVKVRAPYDAIGLSARLNLQAGTSRADQWPMGPTKKARKTPARSTQPIVESARSSWPAVRKTK